MQPVIDQASQRSSPIGNLEILLRLLRLLAPARGLVALSILFGAAAISSGIGLMAASAWIISSAALQPSVAVLLVAIVGVRFFGLTRGLFRYLERIVSHQVTFQLLARLRVWFYSQIEPLAPARLWSYHSGDLISRMLGDIANLENFYVRGAAPWIVAALIGLGTGFYLMSFFPVLGFVLIAFFLLGGLALPAWIRRISIQPGQELVQERTLMNTALVDGIQGMPDLLANNQREKQCGRVDAHSLTLARAQAHMARITGLQTALVGLLANLCLWVLLIVGISLVSTGKMNGVFLATIALAALASFEAILPLPAAAQTMETNLASARRLLEIVDAQPAVHEPDAPKPLPEKLDLRVKGVWFSYPDFQEQVVDPIHRDRWALCDLNLHLPPGKRIAVVGPVGSGKSSLVHLLLRFYDPTRGEILLNDQSLSCYSSEAWRDRIGVVSQSPYIFSATVRENLLLGNPHANQEEIVAAARQAQLHERIQALPEGYDTWIGERGLRLSAGERQKLAIARALLKDPPLLILDEPTANLDTESERQTLAAIRSLMEDRSVLMVTHRLIGMEWMDEVLVLNHGRVIERGTHAELLACGGFYKRMIDIQNQLFV